MTRTVWCLCATALSTKFSHIVNPDDAKQCDACVHCAAALSTKFSHIFNPDDAEQCYACVQQPCLPSFTTYLIRMTLNCVMPVNSSLVCQVLTHFKSGWRRTVWCLWAAALSTKLSHIFNPDDAELCVMPVNSSLVYQVVPHIKSGWRRTVWCLWTAALSTKFSHIINPDDAKQWDACEQQPRLPSCPTYLIRMTLNSVMFVCSSRVYQVLPHI